MTSLADLHRTVQSTLSSQRLGTPVFVRCLVHDVLRTEGTTTADGLAKLVTLVGDWMGATPERLTRLASSQDAKGQTTLVLQFPGGGTALVSAVHGTPLPGVDLMIVGTRGALYHDAGAGSSHAWEQTPASLPARPATEILEAIGQSKDGAPVGVRKPKEVPPTPAPAPRIVQPKYGVLLATGSHTHQENYAAAFAADRRCKLIAVTDETAIDARRKELNERLAWHLGVPYIADLAEALQRKDVDIVSVCAPPERRGRIAVRCVEAGKHLYMDKSLVPQLAEADALVEAVRKAGVRSHMFSTITTPWARAAKRLWASGRLGKPLAVHADIFFAKGKTGTAKVGMPRREEYPPKRHQLVEAKREFDNCGVYGVALLRWLTGKPIRSLYGVTGNYFFAEHQKHNVEDFGLLAGTLDDGLPVTVAAGRYGWTSHPAGGVNRLVLVGSERTFVVDANGPRLEVCDDEKPWVPPNVNPEDPMGFWSSTMAAVHLTPKRAWVPLAAGGASDASYFVDCLEAGKESEMSVREAAHVAEVLVATYRSAATGERVSLPLAR